MPERAQAALDLLVADVARFQGLVEDLLEISRFDAGVGSARPRRARVAELVPPCGQAVSADQHIPVAVAPEVDGDTVKADKRRLARVIANLIDNARVHGGGASLVSVEHVKGNGHGDTVQIAVEDHGPGVPPRSATLIFERFARGAGAGRRGRRRRRPRPGARRRARPPARRPGVGRGPADGQPGARFVIELPLVSTSPLSRQERKAGKVGATK